MSDRGLTGPPDDKVVLVGNPGVGKSTIFQYFKTGQFVQEEKLNHHDKAEFTKEWTVGGVKRSITLYDTAGVERHTLTILPTYFRRAKVVILVYSIDNEESFGEIGSNWQDNSMSSVSSARLVLVGNKTDLEENRVVSGDRALQYAVNNDIDKNMVFEISAKTGDGVEAMFDAIAKTIEPVRAPPQHHKSVDKPKQCC